MSHTPRNANLVPSAARTTSGNSGAISSVADADSAAVQLNVTAASGTTPNLAVIVEGTVDGTNWYQLAAFTAKTGTGLEVKQITGLIGTQIRVSWTITGTTPSFTFAVDATFE